MSSCLDTGALLYQTPIVHVKLTAFMFAAMSTDHRRKKESIVSTLMAISHLPSGKNQIELMIWVTQNYKYMSLSNTYMSFREWA